QHQEQARPRFRSGPRRPEDASGALNWKTPHCDAHCRSRDTLPQGETTMRFMILVKASKDSEAGKMPDEKLLAAMGKFNEELVKAGIMLAGEGLHPSSRGARVRFSGSKRTVTNGPFDSKDLIAGYWMWKCKSMEEAIEWAKR